jgi:hypothetical protein
MTRTWALALVAIAGGCAGEPRFADRAVLWQDPDAAPIPVPPEHLEHGTTRFASGAEDGVFRPADRFFSADYGLEATNVNAVDDVPESTWYKDPRRDPDDPSRPPRSLSAAEVERGLTTDEPARPPFRITRALSGGSAAGFVVEDALGRRYALKFDPEDHLGLNTGTDAVCTRLAWVAGWKVPADEVIAVTRADLTIAPDAVMINSWGRKIPFNKGDLDATLWHTAHNRDGSYRAVTSRWVGGHVLGPYKFMGRDRHDKNDRYDHENRRDLRGFGVWAAWVDDVDTMEPNTLDTYVGEAGRGHVEHYQLDVGGSFGAFSNKPSEYWMGDQSYWQFGSLIASLGTLGAVPHRWENPRWQKRRLELLEQYPEFGAYSAEHFAPRKWRAIVEVPAFARMTERDRYWGSRQVAAFTNDELRGAVAAGHYRPEAADYLVETLSRRRDIVARDGFSRVAPLDHFRIDGERLCFTDWWVRAGLGGGEATDYRARQSNAVVGVQRGSGSDGATCVTIGPATGYRVIELSAMRPGERHYGPSVAVHLIAAGGGGHIVGVVR